MSMIANHWALCDRKGAIFYDEYGRAMIFESRGLARSMVVNLPEEYLHVEKVEIRESTGGKDE